MMDELPEFLRRLLPVEDTRADEDEDARPELSVEAAQAIVEGPSLAAVVKSDAPAPVPAPIDRLHAITGAALTKMLEILGMTREQMLAMPDREFERTLAWGKLQLNASETALRTQVRVDENALKKRAVDEWPKFQERLEKARIEARQLREARLGAAKVVEGGTR